MDYIMSHTCEPRARDYFLSIKKLEIRGRGFIDYQNVPVFAMNSFALRKINNNSGIIDGLAEYVSYVLYETLA